MTTWGEDMEIFANGTRIASKQKRDETAAETIPLLAGLPIVGNHDEQGGIILPKEESG